MAWLIELVKEIFRILFEVSMDHPYEEKEELKDVGDTAFDSPDGPFVASDW